MVESTILNDGQEAIKSMDDGQEHKQQMAEEHK